MAAAEVKVEPVVKAVLEVKVELVELEVKVVTVGTGVVVTIILNGMNVVMD